MSRVRAPSTLRMPISLVRRSAVKEARPNSPRQPMTHREQREGGEALRPRILRLVELGDDVLAELGVERHLVGDLLPLPLDRGATGRRIAGVADDQPAGPFTRPCGT